MTPERFKAIRKSTGLTQEKFGKAVGYSQSSIKFYENGQLPVPDKLIKHLHKLEQDPSYRPVLDEEGSVVPMFKTRRAIAPYTPQKREKIRIDVSDLYRKPVK